MILQASEASQKNRSKVWLNYNVPTMSHMINRAFEHFRMEDNAFDFYYAARQDNPNPRSPAEHIATLLRHAHFLSYQNYR